MADAVNKEPGKDATPEEVREFMVERDLEGLPGYETYRRESKFTTKWSCPDCGGLIPCSIDCPQCGHGRPDENADPEQEGFMGELREKAGYRKPL